MIVMVRRLVAACLLLLHPALIAAPVDAVCVHANATTVESGMATGAADAAAHEAPGRTSASLHHDHGPSPGHAAHGGSSAPAHDHGSPDSGCPMDGGQAGCTTQVPLPQTAALRLVSSEILVHAGLASSSEPHATDPASIFRPPRG
jgi:hypothetical protein